MELNLLNPRKSLNSAFRKVKPERRQIEQFKKNLLQLLDSCNDIELEEHHKNLVIDFLKKTYYDPDHFVNTKGRTDLVIHNGDKGASSVGVIVETKKPDNRHEMVREGKVNVKAFQELLLYYLRERITNKNTDIKYLIVTNINEWYIFDAHLFDKLFAQNKRLVKQFEDFESHRLSGNNTDFFYGDVAAPAIEAIDQIVDCTWFDFRDYEKALRNNNPKDDNKLIALYKLLSPQHLLKLPFANDSNSLDRRFYSELLHIIGLSETKQGSKKIIQRNAEGQRNAGSLLENAISKLESLDKINRLEKPSRFGSNYQERLFNVGLELVITWINRVLFLKLMEAQLVKYHKGDKSYEFLNSDHIHDYDDLEYLFFSVLARPYEQRGEEALRKFGKVPYLNSSLFESASIEDETILVSNLRNDKKISILSTTVLKDQNGKKRTGQLETLEYLFAFLNAYDFSSEGGEEIQEENKTLINASVLGLIFEKINGYKDGSFFTPGFITMYMSRETIRRAVVQKFNETKGWDCKTIDDLYDRIEDRDEANKIINSLKVCDPAVGSGHFLVSALNEIVAIKHDLRVLQDREGRRLKEYGVEVANDELVITDEDGDLFEYRPGNKESQRVQETLFHEKQTIIENCLFGVDINPNSVKICRLRLWIELLKNAYYVQTPTPAVGGREGALETLPNIDINIKEGNSLISRFDIDADLKKVLKKNAQKWSVDSYRIAVQTYRNAESKEQKHKMKNLINLIKSDFKTDIDTPFKKKISKARGRVDQIATEINTQKQWGERISKRLFKDLEKATQTLKRLEKERDTIESNKIYENAFEWRFEFPEVLDDDGNFVGFDVVIGNPPYISAWEMHEKNEEIRKNIVKRFNRDNNLLKGHWDLYIAFILLSLEVGKQEGQCTYIIPNPFLREKYAEPIRRNLIKETNLREITLFEESNVFDDVARRTIIFSLSKEAKINETIVISKADAITSQIVFKSKIQKVEWEKSDDIRFNVNADNRVFDLLNKIESNSLKLGNLCYVNYGAQVSSKEKGLFKKSDVVTDYNKGDSKKFIEGKDIHRWTLRDRGLWLDYRADEMYGPRFEALFSNIKIVFRKVSDRGHKVAATVDMNGYFTDDGCVLAVPFIGLKEEFKGNNLFGYEKHLLDLDINIVLAQLLSKIVSFYFKNKFSTESLQGETSHTYPKSVRQLPICVLSGNQQDLLRDKASQILALKKQDSAADTTALEAEIDRLVYELYGLTEEEIQIVEESVG